MLKIFSQEKTKPKNTKGKGNPLTSQKYDKLIYFGVD
jgi:hypothetical protein